MAAAVPHDPTTYVPLPSSIPTEVVAAFLAGDGREGLRVGRILGPMLKHEPDGSLSESGINLLRHDAIFSTQKETASNPGRFAYPYSRPSRLELARLVSHFARVVDVLAGRQIVNVHVFESHLCMLVLT